MSTKSEFLVPSVFRTDADIITVLFEQFILNEPTCMKSEVRVTNWLSVLTKLCKTRQA